ncbi:hypothetical protein K7472_18530 [Streptomyces sp. PTM05]|uniref:Secreted protein n=1 Tax=Streptantibioticus parmotrematis TaxID=2873249 RepID=A0ABS7QVW3_9ACTN|nr:hypothetical protein [Streptantibioticus parmotrematis]MBY8886846.1 hypothetical protein [Streptantibioticus parmotrematis]
MTSIRTARVLAAVAALPLAAALFTGTAVADNGSFADHGSIASVNSTQQVATGAGATNQSNTASVNGSGFTHIDQNNVKVNFTHLW